MRGAVRPELAASTRLRLDRLLKKGERIVDTQFVRDLPGDRELLVEIATRGGGTRTEVLRLGGRGFARIAAQERGIEAGARAAVAGARRRPPVLGQAARAAAGLARRRPIETAVVAGITAPFAASVISGFARTAQGTNLDELIEAELAGQTGLVADSIRAQRLQRLVGVNTARLAALRPDIAMQLSAGRRLPQGGIFIGRPQGQGLLEELALSMATGGFQSAGTVEDQVLARLAQQAGLLVSKSTRTLQGGDVRRSVTVTGRSGEDQFSSLF